MHDAEGPTREQPKHGAPKHSAQTSSAQTPTAPARSAAETTFTQRMRMLSGYQQVADDVPTDDAIVLSSVLNDWTYDDLNRMLGTIGAATPPGGRLLLIELVLPPDGVVERVGDTHPLTVSALGGRGHTEAEWTSVLAACGFRLERIRPGAPPFSFLEAVRQ